MTIQGNYVGGLIPSAEQVGARPNTWMPTAEEVGAFPKDELIPLANGGTGANTRVGATANLMFIGTNLITSPADDTTANWVALGTGYAWYTTAGLLNNQPSQWGFLINYACGSDVFQIWNTQQGGPTYFRSGNASGWSNSFRQVVDSSKTVPIANGGTGATTAAAAVTALGIKDYVTAQGTSGNWHYRKYNSGYCECWCTAGQTVATTQWEAWGGIYLSQPLPSFDFPFPIYGATPNVTAHNVGGNTLGVVTASDVSYKKMYEVRCFRGTKPSSSISVVYNVHVYGRWKE